ncbi:transposase [uncultured Bacteroides sp.]|uniref:transposase n=1 Tax=uncultured Bacteroides sp. TaxID=162156 RepID=UPI00261011A5|nr:transposase [uncultured Bacteroides sp.]
MFKAEQTPNAENLQGKNYTLTDWYLHVFKGRKDRPLAISKYVVADAYFAKATFVQEIAELRFHLVSRLRDDANLMYIYKGRPTGKRGRPKIYGEKIDFENLDYSKMERIETGSEDGELYTLIAYSKTMKRDIRLSYEKTGKEGTNFTFPLMSAYPVKRSLNFTGQDSKSNSATVMQNNTPDCITTRQGMKEHLTSHSMLHLPLSMRQK